VATACTSLLASDWLQERGFALPRGRFIVAALAITGSARNYHHPLPVVYFSEANRY
jgi:hypothetical protein